MHVRRRPTPQRVAGRRPSVHGDDGLTLIEVLVATALMLVLMGASLSLIAASVVGARHTRATDVATSIATAQVEQYRSFTFDSIAMADEVGLPATHDGLPVHVSAACTTCPPHEETLVDPSGDYEITRWVLEVDDAADGTGVDDDDGELIDYKRVIIEVVWSGAGGGRTELVTNIIRDNTTPFVPPQGVRFEIVDGDGNLFENDETEFEVLATINGDDYPGEAEEGTADVVGISAGSGFCYVYAPNILWKPVTGSSPDVQACSVTAETITVVQSAWEFTPCDDGLGGGTSTVTVTSPEGDPVVGATVTVLEEFGPPPFRTSTDAITDDDGVATYDDLPSGLYSVTVTDDTLGVITGELCARPDEAGGGSANLQYVNPDEEEASPTPTASSTESASPVPTPTATSDKTFKFKWKVKNKTGLGRNVRFRITPAGGGTDLLDGPKSLDNNKDHEFQREVSFKYQYFNLYIECEVAPNTWSTVYNFLNYQALRLDDEGKNDLKIHETETNVYEFTSC